MQKILIFILCGYLIFHFLTLSLFPLPWFDEVYFASISQNWLQTGSFLPSISAYTRDGLPEALIYGPVYFILCAIPLKISGLDPYTFRLVTLLFGLLCVVWMYRIFSWFERGSSKVASLLFALAFALDPFFNICLHEGRMDVVALFFLLASIRLDFCQKEPGFRASLWSGLFYALALLTTPRIGYSILPLLLVRIAYLFYAEKKVRLNYLLSLATWCVVVLVLYSIWVFYAFGGYSGAWAVYAATNEGVGTANKGYLGSLLYVPKHSYFLLSIAALLTLWALLFRFREINHKPVAALCLLMMGVWYTAVVDWGPYSSMIIPFVYFYVYLLLPLNATEWKPRMQRYIPVALLLLFNLSFFIVKSIKILSDAVPRNSAYINEFVRSHIPKGSHVAGHDRFYYAVEKNGGHFHLIDKYSTPHQREASIRENFKYDYLLVKLPLEVDMQQELAIYFRHSVCKEIARLESKPSIISTFLSHTGLSSHEDYAYSCILYKRLQ